MLQTLSESPPLSSFPSGPVYPDRKAVSGIKEHTRTGPRNTLVQTTGSLYVGPDSLHAFDPLCFSQYFGKTRRYMQKKKIVNFIFLRKKGDFSDVFSAFYGQRSVTAAWATCSPWSI